MIKGFALGFIILFLAVYTLHTAANIAIPFVMAVFVWYLINAIARGVGKIKIGTVGIPRDISFMLAIFALCGGLWFGYKIIANNAADVMRAAPVYQKTLVSFAQTTFQQLPESVRPELNDIVRFLDIGGLITALVRNFTGIAGTTLIVLFYTGFLLYEQQFFERKLKALSGNKTMEKKIRGILTNIDAQMQKYIAVKTVISMCTGLCTWLALLFFQIDFAAFWGMMAFVLNFIPYVGSMVAIILPTAAAFVQLQGDLTQLVVVGTTVGLIQITWGSIIDPRIMGDSLNLSPIFIILSLAVWGMIWGVPGMFLAIPVLAICVITLSQFQSTRNIAILLSKTGVVADEK